MLRLLVRGHDIKSAARELSISLAAVNERLRTACLKLGVSRSREAARIAEEGERDSIFSVDRQTGVPIASIHPHHRRIGMVAIGAVMIVGIASVALMAVFGSAAGSQSGIPRVVHTSPSAGAVVRPGRFTLSVTFDQPMTAGSFSYVQKSADTFPKCAFPARLSADGRTFTTECEVTAGRDYEIWFNSPPYLNFKSINGTPAEAHQLQFHSGAR